jgi:predicted GNAT family acetyltransferase
MSNQALFIRKAVPADKVIIIEFQLKMAYETEHILLEKDILTKGVEAVFKDTSKGCYYVAVSGQEIIGSLMTTPEWSDWRNRTILWIQSVYVRPEYRNKGVFSLLYHELKTNIENDPAIGGLRLYVDRSNINAQSVYSRVGMDGDHYQVFEWMK